MVKIAEDKSNAFRYTIKGHTVAVVTDGTSVLGLCNIGPEIALPVMEAKSIIFKELGGVDAFPICLDTKDPDEIVKLLNSSLLLFMELIWKIYLHTDVSK